MEKDYDTHFNSAAYDRLFQKNKRTKRRKAEKHVKTKRLSLYKKGVYTFRYTIKKERITKEYLCKEIDKKVMQTSIKFTVVSIKPYLQEYFLTGCRKYAKKQTNKILRQENRKIKNNFEDDYLNYKNGLYHKVFDYDWCLW